MAVSYSVMRLMHPAMLPPSAPPTIALAALPPMIPPASDLRFALLLREDYGWSLDKIEGWIAATSRTLLLPEGQGPQGSSR
jgi:hypothetical protein